MTPDEIRAQIEMLNQRMRSAPALIRDAGNKADALGREWKKQSAQALLQSSGNVEERKARALIETVDAQAAFEIAQREHEYARALFGQLRDELVSSQAVLKSILSEGA